MTDNTPNPLEAQLQGQQACGLEASLLDRLEAAAEGSLTELSTLERQFESELRNIRPKSLQPALMERLVAKAAKADFPAEPRVVAFPGQVIPKAPKRHSWLSAAAAVAILGAMSALLFNPLQQPAQVAGSQPDEAPQSPVGPDTSMVQPAEFSSALSATHDEGIIWPENQGPHRVIKVVYTDKVTAKRQDGSTYEVEKPRVEYYLVPTHSH